MNLLALQNRIHALLEKDTSYPSAGDEDWNLRLDIINDAQDIWKGELNIKDTAIVTASPVAAGTGYEIGDTLIVNSGYLNSTVIVESVDEDGGVLEVRITLGGSGYADGTFGVIGGSGSGCTLAITIPSELALSADVTPVQDPQFIVYWVLSELTSDEDPGMSSKYLQIAQNKLQKMVSNYQTFNYFNEDVSGADDSPISNDTIGFGI